MFIYDWYDYSHEFKMSLDCFSIKFRWNGSKYVSKLIFKPVKIKSVLPKHLNSTVQWIVSIRELYRFHKQENKWDVYVKEQEESRVGPQLYYYSK